MTRVLPICPPLDCHRRSHYFDFAFTIKPPQKNILFLQDNALIEWDSQTLVCKGRRYLEAEVRALAVSPDSALVAVLTFDGVFVYEIGAPPGVEELVSFARDIDGRSGYRRRDDPVQVRVMALLLYPSATYGPVNVAVKHL